MPTIAEVLHTENNRTTDQTLTTAAGTAAGDTIVVVYGSDYYTLADMGEVTASSGTPDDVWHSGGGDVDMHSDGGNLYMHAKAYVWAVEDDGAVDVVIPAAINCDIHGVLLRFSGQVAVDAFAAGAWNGTTSTHDAVAPSVVASAAGEMLIAAWIMKSGDFPGAYTIPGGMSRSADTDANPFSAMTVATESISSSGATGTRTATWPGTALTQWCSISLLVADVGGEEHAGSTAAAAGSSVRPAGAKGAAAATVQPAGATIRPAGAKSGIGRPSAAAGLSASAAGAKGATGTTALPTGSTIRTAGSKHASGTTRMSAGVRIRPQTPDDTPPNLAELGGTLITSGLGGSVLSSGLSGHRI